MFSWIVWFLIPVLIGHVTDNVGRPVPGATVRVVTADGGTSQILTDTDGRFRFEITGPFELTIDRPGYRGVQTSSAELPDGVFQVQIPLLPGPSTQIDRVDLQIEGLDDLGNRDEPGAREGLPKADRLFGLRGGVNVTGIAEGSGQQWVAASGNVFTSSSMAAAVADNPNLSAELSDSSTTTADTLPAGQDIQHGSGYYYHRNDTFNARNFFDPEDAPTPPFKYHFVGADIGGRLREGTYYFLEYWGLRIRQSVTRAATVPNPAWLEGDFSSVPTRILNPETGLPFPGNQIPKQRFHPQGLALAQLYPRPNVPGVSVQNYRAVGRLSTNADSFGFRLDHRWTVSDEVSLEYQFARDTTDDPFNLLSGITNLPQFGVRDALRTHSLRLNNTHVFSAELIHQLRVAVNYLRQPRTLLESAESAAPTPAILITGLSNLGYATNLPQQRRNRTFEVSSDISWARAGSASKFGGTFRYFPFQASLDLYSRGQFQFTGGIFSEHPFANLLLGLPTNALQLKGDTSRNFKTWTASAFAQHDWQVSPTLTLNGGVRYEYQTPFREANGLVANFNPKTGLVERAMDDLYRPDANNFAPRVGLAWQAPLGMVVRAGYGIFYDTLGVGDSLFLLGLNPPFVNFALENNGPVLPRFDLGTAFNESHASTPPSVFSTSPELPNPYLQHWSLSIQRPLWRDAMLAGSYFGQKGTRLRRQINLNQPTPGPASTLDERRPFGAYGNIFQFETSASSIAHAGEARLVQSFRSNMAFEAAYRFSRLIDDATLISMLPQDSHNLRGERGLADFHMKHRFTFSGSYNFRNWLFDAAGRFQSGMPLSAVLGADVAGTGSPIVNRPHLLRDPNVDSPSSSRFFNPRAFLAPQPGTFGNSGRNIIIGPGVQNVDFAATRSFRLSDFTRLQFRVDAYNVFNFSNFVAPPSMQNLADSPDFGALFVARSPRILQFGLKFLW